MLEVRLYVTWLFGPTQELAFPLKNEDPRSPSPLLYVAGYVVLAIPDMKVSYRTTDEDRGDPRWRRPECSRARKELDALRCVLDNMVLRDEA